MILESEFCPVCGQEMELRKTKNPNFTWTLEWFCDRDSITKEVDIDIKPTPNGELEEDESTGDSDQENLEIIYHLQGEFVQRTGKNLEDFEQFVLDAITEHDLYSTKKKKK